MTAAATTPESTRVPCLRKAVAPSRILRNMRAAAMSAPGEISILKTQIPEPNRNQLLVHIEGCGVCASNIPPWEGKPWFAYPMAPGALGHEAWGTVADVGRAVRGFTQGDGVAILSNHACADYAVCDSSSAVPLSAGPDE